MGEASKVGFKKIEAAGQLKKIMADHFLELAVAEKEEAPRIAWCTSVGPAELLRALGFLVYFPENHGAMLGATRMATDCIEVASGHGYSPNICSYLTADIGSFLSKKTPLSRAYGMAGPPRPDVLVFNTNQCRDVRDWFSWYGAHFGVPVVGVEAPRNVGPVTDTHVAYVARQLREMVPTLETAAGQALDRDRLREVVALSAECSRLWREVLETATARPSPLTFFDGTIHMGPAVVMRGTRAAVDYYRLLLAELRERAAQGVAAVEGERLRLYWEGMPVWGKLRDLSALFLELQTCVVASTYCNSWIFDAFDPEHPFESMARAYTELFIVRTDGVKEDYIAGMAERFGVDGVLYHDAWTCPNNSNNRYGMPERLAARLGIPSLTIDGDLNDLRCYSEEQARTKIEAFVEQLGQRARA